MIEEIERLQQDNARYANAHHILMIERDTLQKRVERLERPERASQPPSGAIESLREALRPFAEIGHWMHARPEVPDDEVVIEIRHINNARTAFTRGDFKRASLAYRAAGETGESR